MNVQTRRFQAQKLCAATDNTHRMVKLGRANIGAIAGRNPLQRSGVATAVRVAAARTASNMARGTDILLLGELRRFY